MISTTVVVIGPHITAGSNFINLAKNGKEQPTNLEIIMVTNKVAPTSAEINNLPWTTVILVI